MDAGRETTWKPISFVFTKSFNAKDGEASGSRCPMQCSRLFTGASPANVSGLIAFFNRLAEFPSQLEGIRVSKLTQVSHWVVSHGVAPDA